MDDESKQLLREMRDSTLRHERWQRRLASVVAVAVVLLLALVAFLTMRLEVRMQYVEKTERDTSNIPAASDDRPPDPP
jgi:hypothetical protein